MSTILLLLNENLPKLRFLLLYNNEFYDFYTDLADSLFYENFNIPSAYFRYFYILFNLFNIFIPYYCV